MGEGLHLNREASDNSYKQFMKTFTIINREKRERHENRQNYTLRFVILNLIIKHLAFFAHFAVLFFNLNPLNSSTGGAVSMPE